MMLHRRLSLGLVLLGLWITGCARVPVVLGPEERRVVDRALVEYPAGVQMVEVVRNLTGPIDAEVDPEGNLIVAESGRGGTEPRIFGIRPDNSIFWIYPAARQINIGPFRHGFQLHGPIGGLVVYDGKIYVSHRDANDKGVITAFGYDGAHETIVGNLPAQGDHGMSDIAVSPAGRLWFGVGSATNSGVVGLDNIRAGWVKSHPDVSDVSYTDVKLLPYQFRTPNPFAGLFGGGDVAVTAPWQPFNVSGRTRLGTPGTRNNRPTAAIFSVNPSGGGLRVEAHGVRSPVGVAFSEFGWPYMTNQGMELRGTRPIKNDPDALLKIVSGTWYGWPDFTAHLQPVSDPKFQPPGEMIVDTGYDEVYFLLDHEASNSPDGLLRPTQWANTLLFGVFSPLAGAARLDFVPNVGPLKDYNDNAIVPLFGDRAPFATSGMPLQATPGYKVVRVDIGRREVENFIRNTSGKPASRSRLDRNQLALERPAAVRFDARDGSMYLVDFGVLTMKDGTERVGKGTGRIFKLQPITGPTTQPARERPAPETASAQ